MNKSTFRRPLTPTGGILKWIKIVLEKLAVLEKRCIFAA
jgi:hypothetical protein